MYLNKWLIPGLQRHLRGGPSTLVVQGRPWSSRRGPRMRWAACFSFEETWSEIRSPDLRLLRPLARPRRCKHQRCPRPPLARNLQPRNKEPKIKIVICRGGRSSRVVLGASCERKLTKNKWSQISSSAWAVFVVAWTQALKLRHLVTFRVWLRYPGCTSWNQS